MARLSILAAVGLLASRAVGAGVRRFDSAQPFYEHDPNTPADCSMWWNSDDGLSCSTTLLIAGITEAELTRLNPSVKSCSDWQADRSYCIKAPAAATTATTVTTSTTTAAPTTTPTTSTKTTTTTTMMTTTTTPGNGVQTPEPFQPGMVSNCNRFYLVVAGDTCAVIATKVGVTVDQLTQWNTQIGGSACTGIWAGYNICTGVIGTTPTTTPAPAAATPQPVQAGMVDNCTKFHLVTSGQTCAVIAPLYGVTVDQLAQWNTGIGGTSCTGMWASYYLCVGVGSTTTTPTPAPASTTPQPIQDGMVANCKKFHFVTSGQTCAVIAALYSITVTNFISWNPAAGSSCTGLWASTYACVGI